MTKKKTKTIIKKKSSTKYPWKDSINKNNNTKESTLCMVTNGVVHRCSVYVDIFNEEDDVFIIDYVGMGSFCIDNFKTLSSAKKFAEKELEKLFNMKNMSFN